MSTTVSDRPEVRPTSPYHTSTETIADTLRRLAERFDRMAAPTANIYLGVDLQITGDFDFDVERRQATVEGIAAALGCSVAFNPKTNFYGIPHSAQNCFGARVSVYGEMPAPDAAIARAAAFADVPSVVAS